MRVVSLREAAQRIEAQRCALGLDDARVAAARNKGAERTAAKRRSLQSLADEARRQHRKPPFAARY
jgi:hypothetical protein